MNPADKAQVEQAKFNAKMAKREAGLTLEDTALQADRFTEQARQTLGQGVAILGKTGSLGFQRSARPDTGIDLGIGIDPELAAKARRTPRPVEPDYRGMDEEGRGRAERDYQNQLKDWEEREREAQIARRGIAEIQGVPEIELPGASLYASGSDLLTMASLRDKMERDKRRLTLEGTRDAYTYLLSGENFDEQAAYAKKAARYNAWMTAAQFGTQVASWFVPGPG